MEYLSTEYEIQDDSAEGKGGKVRWVFSRGLGIGKKVLVASLVFSSVPFVLPPLLVISALGFALSIPSGLFFASYACTEKIMSKLLPIPTPTPPLFEYEMVNDEDVSSGGGYIDTEREEEDDMKRGVELGKREIGKERDFGVDDYAQRYKKEPEKCVDEVVEENGYKLDIGDYMDENIGKPLEMAFGKIERTGEEGERKEPIIADPSFEQHVEEILRVVGDEFVSESIGEIVVESTEINTRLVMPLNEGDQFSRASVDLPIEVTSNFAEEVSAKEKKNDSEGIRTDEEKEVDQILEEGMDLMLVNEDPNVVNTKDGTGSKSNAEIHTPIQVTTIVIDDSMGQKEGSEIEGITKEEDNVVKQLMEEIKEEHPVNGMSSVEANKRDGISAENFAKMDTPIEVTTIIVGDRDITSKGKAGEVENENELTKETKGLIEKMKHAGQDDVTVQEIKNTVEPYEGGEVGSQRDVKRTKKHSTKKGEKVVERRDDNIPGEKKNVVESDVPVSLKEGKSVEEMESKNSKDGSEADEETGVAGEPINSSSFSEEEPKSLTSSEAISQVGGKNKDLAVNTSQEFHSRADAKEIAEHEAVSRYDNAVLDSRGGNLVETRTDTSSSYNKNKSGALLKLPVSRSILESKHPGTCEVLYKEEKIWERINATRKVVGYDAPLRRTCIEELKALYLFTGVEPAATFPDNSDLAEANKQLHFLMSTIGLK